MLNVNYDFKPRFCRAAEFFKIIKFQDFFCHNFYLNHFELLKIDLFRDF